LIFKSNGDHPIFVGLADAENEKKQLAALGASSKRGQVVYKSICVACHGGRGLGIYEGDTLLAPPLAESPLFM
jgi:cytochrome c